MSDNTSGRRKAKRWYYATEIIRSTDGTEHHVLRAYEVPRIDDRVLDSVIYLYPSVEAAEIGEESGGTGFLINIPSEVDPNYHDIYAVSNEHVIRAPGYSPVIRVNHAVRMNHLMAMVGNREIIPLAMNQWKPHPDGDDIAIAPLGRLDSRTPRFRDSIPSDRLLRPDVIDAFDIGHGDDVYMVGRFLQHDGKHFNMPSVRSGIISIMPYEGIEFDRGGFKQQAFLIEMRSISGYSGSPVIWKLPIALDVITKMERNIKPEADHMLIGPWLLGVDCGNFKFYNPVYGVRKEAGETKYDLTNLEAKSHSGQAIVIPAWKVRELLDIEEFVMARKEEDRRLSEAQRNSPVERDVDRPKESTK